MSLTLRDATPDDAGLIAGLVRALAAYEKLLHEAVATDADIAEAIRSGLAPAVVAAWDGTPAGFALWYWTFSTFTGRKEMFLEDLFVLPAHRGRGIGKAIFRELARRAVAADCRRLEWRVLDWNAPSIAFYRSIGAVALDDWTVNRLDQAAIAALARA